MALFDLPTATTSKPRTHRELWESLPNKALGYEYLRDEQGQVLKPLEDAIEKGKTDILVTMPTGTGKTILGLLAGRLRQVTFNERVLYLTPTKQLARQVLAESKKLGIPAVDLTGKYNGEVAEDAKNAYRTSAAIGVAAYSTLFNPTPAVPEPSTILLDDIHAAGDFIRSPWRIEIYNSPESSPYLFTTIKALVADMCPDLRWPDEQEKQSVTMLPHRDWLLVVDALSANLDRMDDAQDPSGILRWAWKKLRGHLHKCFCFVTATAITMHPWAPPTHDLAKFEQAKLRVYLSATIDRVGHVERLTGREGIEHIEPESPPVPGKRLILNTNALLPSPAYDDVGRAVAMVGRFPKSLILTPSNASAEELRKAVLEKYPKLKVWGADPDADVDEFKDAKKGVLVLANRYDGIDLGGNSCQHLIIYDVPSAIGPHERFTTRVWHSNRAALSRGRQRIVQGFGRCTRSKADKCVVSLVGEDVVNLLYHPEVLNALPRRLRGELNAAAKFTNPAELTALLAAFSKDDEKWRKYYEYFDNEAAKLPPEQQEDEALRQLHVREVEFSRRIFESSFEKAAEVAVEAAGNCETVEMGKQAGSWHYLASVAADLATYRSASTPFSDMGDQELTRAIDLARGRIWFGDLERTVKARDVPVADQQQVNRILAYISQTKPKMADRISTIMDGLRGKEAATYEAALTELGKSLGLEAFKPDRPGAPDSIWHEGLRATLLIEAKTEKGTGSELSINELRQMGAQPGEVQANEGIAPPASGHVLCITDCQHYAEEKEADLHTIVVARTSTVKKFAGRWCFALSNISHLGAMPAAVRAWSAWNALRHVIPQNGKLEDLLGAKPAETVLTKKT